MTYESASFPLQNRKEFQRATGWERFLRVEREWDKKVINKGKNYFRQAHFLVGEDRGLSGHLLPYCWPCNSRLTGYISYS